MDLASADGKIVLREEWSSDFTDVFAVIKLSNDGISGASCMPTPSSSEDKLFQDVVFMVFIISMM